MYYFNLLICSLEAESKFLASNTTTDSHGTVLQPGDCVTGSTRTRKLPQDHDTVYQLSAFHSSDGEGCVAGTHMAGPAPANPSVLADKFWYQPLKGNRLVLKNTKKIANCVSCPGFLPCTLSDIPKALSHEHQQESLR